MQHIIFHSVRFGAAMFLLTFIIASAIYPMILRMARVWNIYDNPDARKLQRKPVPVLGGPVVYAAIFIACIFLSSITFTIKVVWMLSATGILLVVGVLDDKRKLSVRIRFSIEVLSVGMLILLNHNSLDSLEGIWGIRSLPAYISVPLSLIAGVGIINAINLMDGVDGYSSAYAIMVCICFSVIFYLSYIPYMGILTLICAGALLPFFLHNVFGRTSKMFIGDGGTLMTGTLITVFVFSILNGHSRCYDSLHVYDGIGLIPLVLAILSVCIFDTVRVMFTRIISGHSPFHPDKTHLHHLFIDMGFSHIGTTLSLLCLNTFVVAGWFIAWKSGADVTMQLYVVVFLSLLNTFGIYTLLRHQEKSGGGLYSVLCAVGRRTRWEDTRFWQWMRKMVDGELFAEGKMPEDD